MLSGVLGMRVAKPKPEYLAGLPECELSPGVLWNQDAEVDEGTAHGDVKVEREEFTLHKAKGMSGKASEKKEACGWKGPHTCQDTPGPHFIPVPIPGTHDVQSDLPEMKVTHICIPQAPDKTSRWTTLARLPRFPPSSILHAWERGTVGSELHLWLSDPVSGLKAAVAANPAEMQGWQLRNRGGEDPEQSCNKPRSPSLQM